MQLLKDLLTTLPAGDVIDVRIGWHWTAVVVETTGGRRCGLASTLPTEHHHTGEPEVPHAGGLHRLSAKELSRFVLSDRPPLASVGMATINALLPPYPELWREQSAEEVIVTKGTGKTVALIGHFRFVPRLRSQVGALYVLELQPGEGDISAKEAPDVLPHADVVAITSMALVNHTLDDLLSLCHPRATILLVGPSTPLSPILFEYRVSLLCGSVVMNIDSVLAAVGQGANFRQMHQLGVHRVTMNQAGASSSNQQRR